MNLVTFTIHSPSHASARFGAKAMERNRDTTDSMEVIEGRGERNKKEEEGRSP